MKCKRNSAISAYLQPFWAEGPEAVQAARLRYWKEYRIKHRRESRKCYKALEVSLTASEWKTICAAARVHKQGRSRFVKDAALAYLKLTYIVPDVLAVRDIRHLLTEHLAFVKERFEEHLLPDVIGKLLLVRLAELADIILDTLEHPKLVLGDS